MQGSDVIESRTSVRREDRKRCIASEVILHLIADFAILFVFRFGPEMIAVLLRRSRRKHRVAFSARVSVNPLNFIRGAVHQEENMLFESKCAYLNTPASLVAGSIVFVFASRLVVVVVTLPPHSCTISKPKETLHSIHFMTS